MACRTGGAGELAADGDLTVALAGAELLEFGATPADARAAAVGLSPRRPATIQAPSSTATARTSPPRRAQAVMPCADAS
ncbi:MAG TPA: hypothetical protein VIN03_04890 [Roseateles sp.]